MWASSKSSARSGACKHGKQPQCSCQLHPHMLWDVFVSHAGNSADKPFARALKQILERTGWNLRVFLDDDSLVPGADPGNSMQRAMETSRVAVILFSKEFFRRTATMRELRLLLERHRLRRAELLPVFLRVTVEECMGELTSLLQPGAPQGFTLCGWLACQ